MASNVARMIGRAVGITHRFFSKKARHEAYEQWYEQWCAEVAAEKVAHAAECRAEAQRLGTDKCQINIYRWDTILTADIQAVLPDGTEEFLCAMSDDNSAVGVRTVRYVLERDAKEDYGFKWVRFCDNKNEDYKQPPQPTQFRRVRTNQPPKNW